MSNVKRGTSLNCQTPYQSRVKSKFFSLSKRKAFSDRMIKKISQPEYDMEKAIQQEQNRMCQTKRKQSKYGKLLAQVMSDGSGSIKQFLQDRWTNQTKKCKKQISKINTSSVNDFKVQDWIDNYYSNLLDWSHNNKLCAASNNYIMLFDLSKEDIQVERQQVGYSIEKKANSIKFAPSNSNLCIGFQNGLIGIKDISKASISSIDYYQNHKDRITALDWQQNLILSGSKDKTTFIMDVRSKEQAIKLPKFHTHQVLSIKMYDNLVATGANDNRVAIYDIRKQKNILDSYEHLAAVKAMAWIQSSKTLLTGGGTADKKIKFWGNQKGQVYKEIQTGSQVCGILVSKNTNQIVSCGGFSTNQIIFWDFNGNKLEIIQGKHMSRVLYSCLDPSGQYLATGAGDKNLIVWRPFPSTSSRRLMNLSSVSLR